MCMIAAMNIGHDRMAQGQTEKAAFQVLFLQIDPATGDQRTGIYNLMRCKDASDQVLRDFWVLRLTGEDYVAYWIDVPTNPPPQPAQA